VETTQYLPLEAGRDEWLAAWSDASGIRAGELDSRSSDVVALVFV
jgi:hypothetical protein